MLIPHNSKARHNRCSHRHHHHCFCELPLSQSNSLQLSIVCYQVLQSRILKALQPAAIWAKEYVLACSYHHFSFAYHLRQNERRIHDCHRYSLHSVIPSGQYNPKRHHLPQSSYHTLAFWCWNSRPIVRCHLGRWVRIRHRSCRPIYRRAGKLLVSLLNQTSRMLILNGPPDNSAFKYLCAARSEKLKKSSIKFAAFGSAVEHGGLMVAVAARYSILPPHSKPPARSCPPPPTYASCIVQLLPQYSPPVA